MALLTLSGITTGRGRRALVEGFDLTLHAGRVCHLSGANGTGKTTLLEVAAGLRTPWQGQVTAAAARHWLGHRNGLSAALTPMENLQAWCDLQADVSSAPAEALRALGVYPQRHRPCRQLSAGQRRRTALARLLLAARPVWVLDEPLDGLDAAGLELVATLVNSHIAEGGALLVTSHQPLPGSIAAVQAVELRPA